MQLAGPMGIAFDAAGDMYIANTDADQICKVSSGVISPVAGAVQGYSGDGGPALSAGLDHPFGIALDSKGNLYIADTYNNVVRMVNTQGIITTFAGSSTGTSGYQRDNGPATSALLAFPDAVAVDQSGNVYIAAYQNHVVR
jgi:sugar lactone lactonase YvrE